MLYIKYTCEFVPNRKPNVTYTHYIILQIRAFNTLSYSFWSIYYLCMLHTQIRVHSPNAQAFALPLGPFLRVSTARNHMGGQKWPTVSDISRIWPIRQNTASKDALWPNYWKCYPFGAVVFPFTTPYSQTIPTFALPITYTLATTQRSKETSNCLKTMPQRKKKQNPKIW